MKRQIIYLVPAFLILAIAIISVSCKKDPTREGVPITGITLDKTSLVFEYIDDQEQIKATLEPSDADNLRITWSSSDPNIAEVDKEGMVTAKLKGDCLIYCTSDDNSISAVCEVESKGLPRPIESADFNVSEVISLDVADSIQVMIQITPEKATLKSIRWEYIPAEVVPAENGPFEGENDDIVYISQFDTLDAKQRWLVQDLFCNYLKLGQVGTLKATITDAYDTVVVVEYPIELTIPEPQIELISVPATPAEGFLQGGLWEPREGPGSSATFTSIITSGYQVSKFEVTQDVFLWAMGNLYGEEYARRQITGARNNTLDEMPIASCSWERAQEFIQKLNEKTGNNYRLPTETEWEWAARGALVKPVSFYGGRPFADIIGETYPDFCANPQDPNVTRPPGGNPPDGYWALVDAKYSGPENAEIRRQHDKDGVALWGGGVNHYVNKTMDKIKGYEMMPNELGIYNMLGNVMEWCSDWDGTYPTGTETDYTGPATGTAKVTRGGSRDNGGGVRLDARQSDDPTSSGGHKGIRLVL